MVGVGDGPKVAVGVGGGGVGVIVIDDTVGGGPRVAVGVGGGGVGVIVIVIDDTVGDGPTVPAGIGGSTVGPGGVEVGAADAAAVPPPGAGAMVRLAAAASVDCGPPAEVSRAPTCHTEIQMDSSTRVPASAQAGAPESTT